MSNDMLAHKAVLVVSEDPALIHLVHSQLANRLRVIGCTGPVQSPCNLDTRPCCSLARHASVALVDSPPSGVFRRGWKVVQAGAYAEELQRAHRGCTVILCGAPESSAGPTGGVTTASSVLTALESLRRVTDMVTDHAVKGDGT